LNSDSKIKIILCHAVQGLKFGSEIANGVMNLYIVQGKAWGCPYL